MYTYGQFSKTIVVFFVPGAKLDDKLDHAGDSVGPSLFKELRRIKTTQIPERLPENNCTSLENKNV